MTFLSISYINNILTFKGGIDIIKYEDLYKQVKNILSNYRFKHSLAVVEKAIEYAKIYNIDIETVKLVAISHDIAKEISKEQINEYITKYDIKLDNIEKCNDSLVHAIIGSYICKNEFGFTQDMTNAIRYHTTGRENMSMLEKIIYLADATEVNRENSNYYTNIVKNNLNEGIIEILKFVINELVSDNKMIHPNTIKCYNYYINNNLR